jgi:hypothetical protein
MTVTAEIIKALNEVIKTVDETGYKYATTEKFRETLREQHNRLVLLIETMAECEVGLLRKMDNND